MWVFWRVKKKLYKSATQKCLIVARWRHQKRVVLIVAELVKVFGNLDLYLKLPFTLAGKLTY
jgi:hypothetical protein